MERPFANSPVSSFKEKLDNNDCAYLNVVHRLSFVLLIHFIFTLDVRKVAYIGGCRDTKKNMNLILMYNF